MNKKEFIKRLVLFIISLFFMGLGIAFTKYAGLGISPISSLANVLSIKFDIISFGMWLTASNCLLLLGQIILLRKKFKLFQLFQIPLSFLFGYFTDFGMMIVKYIPCETYIMKLILVFIGIFILGFGIALGVIADVILNSGEAFVKAVSDVMKKEFSTMKVVFDVCWVALSAILSVILFKGQILGIREGTVISALFVGFTVKFWRFVIEKPILSLLKK